MDAAVGPGIPIVNMGIGSAERGGFDVNDGVRWSRRRIGAIGVGQPRLCRSFDKRTHSPIITSVREMPSRTENVTECVVERAMSQ